MKGMKAKTPEYKKYVAALKEKDYDNCLKYTCAETERYIKSMKIAPELKSLIISKYGDAFHGICNLYGHTMNREASFRLRKAYMDMRRDTCPVDAIEALLREVDNREKISFTKAAKQEKDLSLEELMMPAHLGHMPHVDAEYSPHGRSKGANGQTQGYTKEHRTLDSYTAGHPK